MKRVRFAVALLLAGTTLGACADGTTGLDRLDADLGIAATKSSASKASVCHSTGQGTFIPITVGAGAVDAHLQHGDVSQPNGAVPDSPGYVFDSACRPITWAYAVNVVPDAAAQDPASPGNLFVGSGIPATSFATARNEAAGIELGMMVLYRQGPNITSTDTYADGVLDFSVASGPQSLANGSFANNAGRAAWNYVFSVVTGLNGATTDLSDFTFQILLDLDPSSATNYQTLTLEPEAGPQASGQSGFQWRDQGTNVTYMADDEGNVNVTQNSQNYAFYAPFTAPYAFPTFAGPAKFDIILQALDGSQVIARNHIAVNVIAP